MSISPHDSLLPSLVSTSLSHCVPASLLEKMSHSKTEDQTFADLFEFYIEGVMLLGVAVLGILGNLFFIIVFSTSRRTKKINTFHSLMVSLAYFDSLYIVCSVFVFALPLVYPACSTTFLFTNSITILLPLAHIGLNG